MIDDRIRRILDEKKIPSGETLAKHEDLFHKLAARMGRFEKRQKELEDEIEMLEELLTSPPGETPPTPTANGKKPARKSRTLPVVPDRLQGSCKPIPAPKAAEPVRIAAIRKSLSDGTGIDPVFGIPVYRQGVRWFYKKPRDRKTPPTSADPSTLYCLREPFPIEGETLYSYSLAEFRELCGWSA